MSPSRRSQLHVVLLAAGLGKRMRSARAKVLHPVAGRPMLAHPLAAAAALRPRSIVVVVGRQADEVRRVVAEEASRLRLGNGVLRFALQARQLGTGHALLMAEPEMTTGRGEVLILSGDVPAIRPDTLRRMLRRHRAAGAAATVLTTELPDPSGYGRIVRGAGGDLERIVEHADAGRVERRIPEVNTGIYVADVRTVFDAVRGGGRTNAQKEYYLTDMVQAFRRQGRLVLGFPHPDAEEVMGVNDRRELARAGRLLVRRALERLMDSGVTVVDPARTEVDPGVRVGRDSVLHPGVTLAGNTQVGAGCVIHPGVRVQDSVLGDGCVVLDHCLLVEARLGAGVRVGPLAHLRPGSVLEDGVHLGNFVETKKTVMRRGSKANHLTYLGDAEVGPRVNVGAGTITCNYDGVQKHRTVIEEGAFIGSDTQLVAPVRVGRGAYVGAGSTIVEDVPDGALALSRSPQTNREGWADERRRRLAEETAHPPTVPTRRAGRRRGKG